MRLDIDGFPEIRALRAEVLRLRAESRTQAGSLDVRVLAATHRDLPALVAAGRFREDLYYRLRGATIDVPPLRARLGDLPLLIRTFLDAGRATRKQRRLMPTQEALRALHRYAWPGNVRELRAEVERWFIFCDDVVDVADLAVEIRAPAPPQEKTDADASEPSVSSSSPPPAPPGLTTLAAAVAHAERAAIAAALAAHQNNLARTARTLGIDRNTLKRKLALYELGPVHVRSDPDR